MQGLSRPQWPLILDPPFTQLIKGWLRALAGYLFLGSTLLAINVLQLISLVFWPLSRRLFRWINRLFASLWWGWCALGTQRFFGVEPLISGDEIPAGENALLFANHQQMADILMLMLFVRRERRLGDLKWFVKHPLKYVPGVGWGMVFLDCLFVKRDWSLDRGKIEATFRKFKKRKIPIWLVTFVEGTRISSSKLVQSQELAMEKGWRIPRHVLIPRTRGFCAALEGLEGHVDAVYDVTIGYYGGIPSLTQVFRGLVSEVRIDVKRFPVKDLPTTSEARSQWLRERFERKDALLAEWFAP